ncbi:hypothetical protein Thimo_2337 [Thioflavicoccus mobilis 8321]|uniref:Uncharacterized protein n=1 Tax=Thioflavicoccus mobilis 8321 TaxID=765912 RepID=L0GYP6_9GAMM|nr:hypothetical protein [Thioflavicoccus mobilis]AGA91076.1 hypothetical protein Thimo_2337 [Thioflavicoccus mobilis 8321]
MKRYGIRVTLPDGDPMGAAHLLGEGWEYYRWYETAAERDEALADMQRRIPYYRAADRTSERLEKVDR